MPPTILPEIQLLLEKLGLSSAECRVLLALAEAGGAPVATIAKRCQMARSTVYTAVESLGQRGMVSVEYRAEVAHFVPNPPESLRRMVEQERQEHARQVEERARLVEGLLPMLTTCYRMSNYSVPRLQFVEGESNVRKLLAQNLTSWQESIAKYDNTWWGYQDPDFVDTYKDWLGIHWGQKKNTEKICLLSNGSQAESALLNKIPGRTVRVVPQKFQFTSSIWVLGDFVVTIMNRQTPHYAVQLLDPVFAANQRMTFQLLWSLLGT